MVKNLSANAGDTGSLPGSERSPGEENGKKKKEKKMATHTSMLPWEIPWTEEPGGLQSVGSKGVGYDVVTKPPSPLCVIRNHHGLD